MKLLRIPALGAVACLGLALLGPPAEALSPPAPKPTIRSAGAPGTIPGSYIVVLKEGARSTASNLATRYGGKVKLTYTTALRGFSASLTEAEALRLAADPEVSYVEQDGIARASDRQANPTWGLDRIDQAKLPLDQGYTYATKAAGVTAYIVDTGIYKTHSDFGGRATDGYDFIDNDAVANDCNGHGTHVAGTVGSTTYGVAKGVALVGVRVLDCQGNGEWSQVIGGIDWVAKNAKKPAVANMSLGGEANTSVDDAVKRAIATGVTFSLAAGNNNGANACNTTPARTPEAITVGSTDNQDNRSSFSNIGSCLDLFAPGSGVTSTWNNGGTNSLNGTSMATPHVSGAVALYLAGNPTATPAAVASALTGNASAGVVKNAGTGSPNKLLYTGFIGDPVPPTCAGGASTEDAAIPDAGAAVSTSTTITGCDGNGTSTTTVRVDINHSYTGDLQVDLVGPSGAVINLRRPGGVGSPDGLHQTFTANTSGETRNGTWKLQVKDVYRFDTGTLDGWSLNFAPTAANYEADTVPVQSGTPGASFYGGQDATVSEFPAIIAGLRAGGSRPQGQSCTGTAIAPRKILIAAHCADAAGEKSFLYGLDDLNASGGTRLAVTDYKKHPKYVNFDQGYDVAVVTTATDIPVPGGKYPAVATSADAGLERPGGTGLGFGYGKKDFNDTARDVTLDKASLPIVDGSQVCTGVGAGFKAATMVCAGYSDGRITILPGDSGGPLIVQGKVIGVASWSRSDFKWYSVYGRLTNDMGDWVKQQIGDQPPTGDFGVAVSPSSVKVAPGKYISTTVTSTAGSGGAENLTLSASGLPTGAKATFQPESVSSGSTAKLTFEAGTGTPAGNHTVTVTATNAAGKTATANVTLTVEGDQPPTGDVQVTATPSSGTVAQGQLAQTTVKASGGTGNLTLTASGVPAGTQVFFNPQSIAQNGSSNVWFFTNFQTPRGTHVITVTARSADGKTGTTKYSLTVR
ncbi:S8 family serine peptidase [Kribbella catacumbae]|uniref:S8 family serine peptidase n=1 Tax=Kribbella catacumbae TaxID=460086 RepID=UPI000372415C|nr:S8 family serine peptidase [Kribbella catacumbae]